LACNESRRNLWFAVALFSLGFLLLFRGWFFTGFDAAFGDKEDGYVALALIEHWHHVFTGAAYWTDPIFFYPQRGTLGYTDAYFLLGLFSAPLRMIGADTFTSFMLTVTAMAAIGFFGFRQLAVRHFGLPDAYSSIGGFLFAFGNLDAVKLIHVQSYCAMLLPGLCAIILSGWSSRRHGAVLGAVAGLLYGALFLTSFQTAWFFGCYLLLLMPLHLAIRGPVATQLLIREAATLKRALTLAAACGFAVAIAPFFILYIPVALAGHSRDFAEAASNLPEWRDMANVTPENAVWGAAMKWLAIAGRPDRPVWEVELAFTPAVLAAFMVGFMFLIIRARNPLTARDSYLLMFATAVVVFWSLQMDYFGIRPWRAVWALVPGGDAIRYPFRSQLVANLFVSLVVVRVFAGLERRRIASMLLGGLLLIEQINLAWPPIVSRREALAWIEAVPPPPGGCRTFYLAPGAEAGGPIPEERQAAAMLFAEIRNIPTVNGYSSWFPDGWTLDDPSSPTYPTAVADWARRNGIEHDLCALALHAGRWMSPS